MISKNLGLGVLVASVALSAFGCAGEQASNWGEEAYVEETGAAGAPISGGGIGGPQLMENGGAGGHAIVHRPLPPRGLVDPH